MSEQEVICEVNGVVVLCRRPTGTLEAPEGLGGIAAYFESEGTPEDLYGRCRERVARYRGALKEIANEDVKSIGDGSAQEVLIASQRRAHRALSDGEDDG